MKKLTVREVNYILGLKKTKLDWMFEGTIEELDNGYHLILYVKKPVYFIIRPLLYPFAFVYFVLEGGVKEAKEEMEERCGREVANFYLYEKECERAKAVIQSKGE